MFWRLRPRRTPDIGETAELAGGLGAMDSPPRARPKSSNKSKGPAERGLAPCFQRQRHRQQAEHGRQRGHHTGASGFGGQRDALKQDKPSARRRLVNSTIRVLLDTTIPTHHDRSHQRHDVQGRAGHEEDGEHTRQASGNGSKQNKAAAWRARPGPDCPRWMRIKKTAHTILSTKIHPPAGGGGVMRAAISGAASASCSSPGSSQSTGGVNRDHPNLVAQQVNPPHFQEEHAHPHSPSKCSSPMRMVFLSEPLADGFQFPPPFAVVFGYVILSSLSASRTIWKRSAGRSPCHRRGRCTRARWVLVALRQSSYASM